MDTWIYIYTYIYIYIYTYGGGWAIQKVLNAKNSIDQCTIPE